MVSLGDVPEHFPYHNWTSSVVRFYRVAQAALVLSKTPQIAIGPAIVAEQGASGEAWVRLGWVDMGYRSGRWGFSKLGCMRVWRGAEGLVLHQDSPVNW